ncbi:MAG: epimerase [Thermoplasmata archaeon]|nr:MAG: epimerase [Thermoplasmata archaeon]
MSGVIETRIVITGASGQVGSYLIDILRSHDIVGLDMRPPKIDAHKRCVHLVDVRFSMDEFFRGCDAVVHSAAQVSVAYSIKNPKFDAENNVVATVNVLECARKNDARVIFLSSAAVYGEPEYVPIDEEHPKNPKSPYGISKLTGERYVQLYQELYGLKCAIVRPFNIYSPRARFGQGEGGVIYRFVERAIKGSTLHIFGDGKQTRDFIHAKDVARMITLILQKDLYSVFNCGSGVEVSLNTLAYLIRDEIKSNLGREVDIQYLPPREGEIVRSCADMSRAREVLGFSTKISLLEGISELINELSKK